MLASRSAARLVLRSPSLLRRMSSIYVLPIDPSAPAATAAPVDATKLWTSTPAANAPKPSKAGTTTTSVSPEYTGGASVAKVAKGGALAGVIAVLALI